MPVKKRLVYCDVFQGGNVFSRLAGQHAINQQEWIAVREVFEHFMDIHERTAGALGIGPESFGHTGLGGDEEDEGDERDGGLLTATMGTLLFMKAAITCQPEP